MALSPKPEVLIVGAGPSGLTLALELARFDTPFRIIDKAAGPALQSRALAIQARPLELFDARGFADEFVAAGLPMRAMNMFGRHLQQIAHVDFSHLPSRFPYLLSLPQSETEQLLARRLEVAGHKIERGVELADLKIGPDEVAVSLRTSAAAEQAAFGWVVGCDGSHSRTRELSQIAFSGQDILTSFVLADLRLKRDAAPDEAYMYATPHGLLALFPFRDGSTRVITDIPPGELIESGAKSLTLEQCQALISASGLADVQVESMVWSSVFHIHTKMADCLRRGRILLVGDAAHIHSPALGQGMNTGIQDAINLGWKLAHVVAGKGGDPLLDTYESERLPVERAVLNETHFVTQVMTQDHPLLTALRDELMHFAFHIQSLQERLTLLISQLEVCYGQSVAVGGSSNGDVQPGGRAPDLSLDQADGKARIYELLRVPAHLLLLFVEEAAVRPECLQIQDAVKTRYGDLINCLLIDEETEDAITEGDIKLRDMYGDAEAILIRPDGYAGFIGERKGLNAYLEHLFEIAPAKSPSGT